MRPAFLFKPLWLVAAAITTLGPLAASERIITSTSLNPCQEDGLFTAQLFNVVFTPDNGSLLVNMKGVSSISGNVIADFQIIAYGFNAYQATLNPCKTAGLEGMCPMNAGPLQIPPFNLPIPQDVIKQIPSIAYGVPDLDGLVKIRVNTTSDSKSVACVEAELSNGKTVDQKGVGWTTAVIAGLALLASAVTSGLGHSNTAAHVAANALSLFGFFQSQAIIGMTGVPLPPIVASWTQNFQWTMGIIRVGFLQDICTWYQRSTGGTPSTLVSNLSSASVQVQKRAIESFELLVRTYDQMARRNLTPRSNDAAGTGSAAKTVVVQGIERVGFRAHIEPTNIFLTGLIFFMVFVVFTAIGVALFKGFCEMAVKAGWFKGDKFEDFRNGWKIVLKGILFRLVGLDNRSCKFIANGGSGIDWLPPNLCALPLGTDSQRLGSRSGPGLILFHLHDNITFMGCVQGLPHRKALGQHAQESCIHSLLGPVCTEQMGIPLCPIPSHGILLHHACLTSHLCQVSLPCFCTEERNCASYRTSHH